MRRRYALAIALFGCIAVARAEQAPHPRPDSAALQQILTIEDARATSPGGAAPLLVYLASSDTLLRRVAVRAVGRLQRPDLVSRLVPLLNDPVPAIRAEAANAIAQAVSRATRRP